MRDRVNYSGDRTGVFFHLIQHNRGCCWKVDMQRELQARVRV
jgi:hypothetical protein